MSQKEIYLDNNATTHPLSEVREEMMHILDEGFGNPSSKNGSGDRAREYLNKARERLADLLGCESRDLIFTSSGTESNNWAFYSAVEFKGRPCNVLTTNVEHSSIKKMCSFLSINGVEVKYLSVDRQGHIDLDKLNDSIDDNTALVSVQWVNNETGVIQPVEEIISICKKKNVLIHTDAAQAVGKLEFALTDFDFDFLSLTGHKFHSPQGAGAIYAKDRFLLRPMFFGGFQEENFRPGTENVPGIVGMGKAAEVRKMNIEACISDMMQLRDSFEAMILDFIPGTVINGDNQNRVCNTTNILFKDIDGRILTERLDQNGIRCSQSSACTNFQIDPSYVLCSMGLRNEEAYSSIRFSFCVENNLNEIEKAARVTQDLCEELRS